MGVVDVNQEEYNMSQKNAQCRLCRRSGKKLYLKGERCNTSKCALVKRNYAPGLHGQKLAGGRVSDYGKQLREKQSAKVRYNLTEKQFKGYFDKAVNHKDETGQVFFGLLETRLDNVMYRAGLGLSIKHARQLVNHAHFTVNGKKVNIPSYKLKVNDVVGIRPSSLKNNAFTDLKERMKNREVSDWIFYDEKESTVKVTQLPDIKKISTDFDMKSIIEFYSR